jgi:hypothetical protein
VVVAAGDETLTLTTGSNHVKTFLQHRDRDTFDWRIPELDDAESLASFQVRTERAETLTIEALYEDGVGVFRRVER